MLDDAQNKCDILLHCKSGYIIILPVADPENAMVGAEGSIICG